MVTACGGDPVGNWEITSSCIKAKGTMDLSSTCSAGVNASASITGTSSFNADLSYSFSWLFSGSEAIGYPSACLTLGAQSLTCDDLSHNFMAATAGPTLTGTCVAASGGGCRCNVTFNQFPMVEGGTYLTSGGMLTLNSDTGNSDPNGYCVQGNRMDLTVPAMMMPAMTPGATSISTGDLTFARR
jgi:hypothetical protein